MKNRKNKNRGQSENNDNYNPYNKINNSKFNSQDNSDTTVKKGNKGLKIVIGIIVLLLVVFLALGLIMRFTVNKNNNNPPQNIEENLGPSNVDNPIEEIPIEEPIEGTPVEEGPIDEPVMINRMDYESKIIGIGFNYDTAMYLEENTDRVFNVLKASSDGKDTFNILEDKVVEDLEIMTLNYQGNDKLITTLSLKQMGDEFEFSIDSISEYINGMYNIQEIIEETVEEVEETKEVEKKKDNKKNNKEKEDEEEIEEVIDNRIIIDSFSEISPIQTVEAQNETLVSEYLIVQNGNIHRIIRGYISIGVNVIEVVVQTEGDLEGIDTYGIFEDIVSSLEIVSEGV